MSELSSATGLCSSNTHSRGLGMLTALSFAVTLKDLLTLHHSSCDVVGLADWFPSSNLAGRGGASIYGKQFEDELHPDLKFTGKYIVWLDWVGRRSGF